MNLRCPDCSQVVDYPDFAAPTLTNTPSCSIAIFEHPRPVGCICGAQLMPVLARVERVAFNAAKIVRRSPPAIIVPGRT